MGFVKHIIVGMRKNDLIVICLLAFVIGCRYSHAVADFYALRCYPAISSVLSRIASVCPISLEEVIVIGFVTALVMVAVRTVRRKKGFLKWLGGTSRVFLWLVVWFYIGWGNNYFRTPLYPRIGIERASFERTAFDKFLDNYTAAVNGDAGSRKTWDKAELESDVKTFYSTTVCEYGYTPLRRWQRAKTPLLNPLYSAVGVLGFMGPFLCEPQLNRDLPDIEYPFTLAHELAHLAGVTSEAEANYWAYAYCRQSGDPAVRYSGLIGVLPFVASCAAGLLPDDDYDAWAESLAPEVKEDYKAIRNHWDSRRVKAIDDAQRWMMDLFLKSNKVSEGARDYAGVIGIIMMMEEYGNIDKEDI